MCSAWTVTLHFQTLTTLARALRAIGRAPDAAAASRSQAQAVQRDFQRLLLVDGVLAGYAHVRAATARVRYLLHPSDDTTGVHYSALAMIHAILEDLLTPAQAREHLRLIDAHLSGPDGVRLFDRPMPYHGGPQRLFQRAESATFFGREIGLMYMHAHLRYAQALAHVGEAAAILPGAVPGQSDRHPLDRAERDAAPGQLLLLQLRCRVRRSLSGQRAVRAGRARYDRARRRLARVFERRRHRPRASSLRVFLGLSCEARLLRVDPVIPAALDGLRVDTTLLRAPGRAALPDRRAGCGVKQTC